MILSTAKLALLLLFPFASALGGVSLLDPTPPSFHPVCSPSSNRRPAALLGQRASLPFSSQNLRARSRSWKWGRLSISRWKWVQTDSLYIRTNARLKEVRKVGVYVESFLASVQGGSLVSRLTLHIFGDRDAFLRYALNRGRGEGLPFFDSDYNEVVTFLSSKEDRDFVLDLTRRVIKAHCY